MHERNQKNRSTGKKKLAKQKELSWQPYRERQQQMMKRWAPPDAAHSLPLLPPPTRAIVPTVKNIVRNIREKKAQKVPFLLWLVVPLSMIQFCVQK